jgi:hypothetical protein
MVVLKSAKLKDSVWHIGDFYERFQSSKTDIPIRSEVGACLISLAFSP